MSIEQYIFQDDGVIPNNRLPVLVYRQACLAKDKPAWLENRFIENGWTNNWRDVIMLDDHFHSTTHEVLGVGHGKVSLKVGGINGIYLNLNAGDVLVIPAGVGHFSLSNDKDYEIVGGYPNGMAWDIMTGSKAERELALRQIEAVSLPLKDPISGLTGKLLEYWH